MGAAHRKVAERCQTCHASHAARVDASDCIGCHESVRKREGKLRPPIPFDTTKALQQSSGSSSRPLQRARERAAVGRSSRAAMRTDPPPPPTLSPIHAIADSPASPATRSRSPTRKLTFEAPRGCQICHHQRPATSECATCHQSSELARRTWSRWRWRSLDRLPARVEVAFQHKKHGDLACVKCHTTRVSLEPEPAGDEDAPPATRTTTPHGGTARPVTGRRKSSRRTRRRSMRTRPATSAIRSAPSQRWSRRAHSALPAMRARPTITPKRSAPSATSRPRLRDTARS